MKPLTLKYRRRLARELMHSVIASIENLGLAVHAAGASSPIWADGFDLVNDSDLESRYQAVASDTKGLHLPEELPKYVFRKRTAKDVPNPELGEPG